MGKQDLPGNKNLYERCLERFGERTYGSEQ